MMCANCEHLMVREYETKHIEVDETTGEETEVVNVYTSNKCTMLGDMVSNAIIKCSHHKLKRLG